MPEFPTVLWLRVLVAVLAIWRLSSMLVQEAGPLELLERLRFEVTDSQVGDLLSCVWCTSFWVAWLVLLAMLHPVGWWVLSGLAGSAGAIIVQEQVQYWKR